MLPQPLSNYVNDILAYPFKNCTTLLAIDYKVSIKKAEFDKSRFFSD
jgi:hypothetical protein